MDVQVSHGYHISSQTRERCVMCECLLGGENLLLARSDDSLEQLGEAGELQVLMRGM